MRGVASTLLVSLPLFKMCLLCSNNSLLNALPRSLVFYPGMMIMSDNLKTDLDSKCQLDQNDNIQELSTEDAEAEKRYTNSCGAVVVVYSCVDT